MGHFSFFCRCLVWERDFLLDLMVGICGISFWSCTNKAQGKRSQSHKDACWCFPFQPWKPERYLNRRCCLALIGWLYFAEVGATAETEAKRSSDTPWDSEFFYPKDAQTCADYPAQHIEEYLIQQSTSWWLHVWCFILVNSFLWVLTSKKQPNNPTTSSEPLHW